jgi:hypothetical protein
MKNFFGQKPKKKQKTSLLSDPLLVKLNIKNLIIPKKKKKKKKKKNNKINLTLLLT